MRPVLAVLAAGVFAVSVSSILVRMAQTEGVPSMAIATWRVILASVLLLCIWMLRRPARSVAWPMSTKALACFAGAMLAAHFILWIVALESLSIAVCAALLATNPVWVGLAAWFWMGERSKPLAWLGVAVTVFACLGLVFVARTQSAFAGSAAGAWLALGSAFSFSGYILCGRRLRAHVGLSLYFLVVTLVAALVSWLTCVLLDVPMTGFSATAWWCLAGLAAIPHVIGHGALNWAARRMPATPVATVTLAEPLCAAALAWALLGEKIRPTEIPVFLALLAGIALVVWSTRKEAEQ
ncbi:MAG: DMT family transporter [Betaproteobacteria bacterium]|nr:DMT family transporter [Betaproteobacteria bacterium]